MSWTTKSKITSNSQNKTKTLTIVSQNKTKIPTRFERTRILTFDGNQILAGASEDKVLISQEEGTMWNFKTKTTI